MRINENVCSSSGGAQGKGKMGSKLDETQFGTKSGAFLSLTPSWRLMYFIGGFSLISPGFGPNLKVSVLCFLDFMESSIKHPKNRCPYVLIPLKVIKKDSTDTFWSFQKVNFQWEETGEQVFKRVIIVCENLWFSLWESEWKPWRFSLKKWEPPNTRFYLCLH